MKHLPALGYLWLAILAVALVAVACSAPAAPAPTAAPAKPAAAAPAQPAAGAFALSKDYKASMATCGTSGAWYPLGGAIANVFNKNIKGITVTAEVTASSVENARLLGNKQAEIALLQNSIADFAQTATEMFKDQKITNIRGIGSIHAELMQWAVTADIKSFQDLKGKNFMVGQAGSGSEAQTRQVFESSGIMTYKDLGKATFLSNAEAVTAFKDRKIDGFAITGGVPMPPIVDVATSMEVNLVPIDGDLAQKAMAKYKSFVPAKIPANTYKGVTKDVSTLAVKGMLVARDDVPDEVAYNMAKVLVEKQDELIAGHALNKEYSKDTITQGMPIPLHPGAEKYYKEAGILK